MKKAGKIFLIALILLGAIWFLLFTPVDRTPYVETDFYQDMDVRLDSLASAYRTDSLSEPLHVGWSKLSITPPDPLPLAGYSNRDPKLMSGISDSVFVRTTVFRSGQKKVALVSADLLIFHPVVTSKIEKSLPRDWSMQEVYLGTTHTHSGPGGWAPGIVGEAIAGSENDTVAQFIADQVALGIEQAEKDLAAAQIGLVESNLEHLVHNRLVHEEGERDPWLKSLMIAKEDQLGILNFFSAHATCLNSQWHQLSGDFPGRLNQMIEKDSMYDFSLYAASAVGSMGPVAPGEGIERVESYANQIHEQLTFLPMLLSYRNIFTMNSFRITLPLRDPHVKVTEDWAVRPFLFKKLAGHYPVGISVFKMGTTVFIGIPADFSGELALPLYETAKELGLNLIITSFNGGYIGYVIKDEWYDLNKYESRSMSWYGPDNGAYLSEVIERILRIVA